MLRYKSATSDVLIDTRPANVLYDETSVCFAHSIHNLGRAALNEAGVVGHVHAVTYVFGLNHHRKRLWGALEHLVSTEGGFKAGPPPPDIVAHNKDVFDKTVLRSLEIVRSRADEVDISSQELSEQIRPLRTFVNDDLRVPRVGHWCNQCCLDENGRTSFSVQVANMCACLFLLLGGLFCGEKPALNRWLSTSKLMAYVGAGFMVHGILPRVWRLAFGEGEIPRGPLDSWHTYVKSKFRRICTWFSLDTTEVEILMFAHVSGPIDHLLMVLQRLDAEGSTLRELFFDRNNPVWRCLCTYFDMVNNPAGDMKMFWFHFLPLGLDRCHQISRALHGVILSLASALWRHVAMILSWFPFKLVGLVLDHFG